MNNYNYKIFNTDCIEKMKELEDASIDMILCDLPYGTTDCAWDTVIPFDKLWEQYERIIKEDGAIVINTVKDEEQIKKLLKGYKGKVYCIDARKISEEALGRYFPNTPMLAAIVKVAGIMDEDAFLADMQGSFKHKFAKKPEVIDGNMNALKMALSQVKQIQ